VSDVPSKLSRWADRCVEVPGGDEVAVGIHRDRQPWQRPDRRPEEGLGVVGDVELRLVARAQQAVGLLLVDAHRAAEVGADPRVGDEAVQPAVTRSRDRCSGAQPEQRRGVVAAAGRVGQRFRVVTLGLPEGHHRGGRPCFEVLGAHQHHLVRITGVQPQVHLLTVHRFPPRVPQRLLALSAVPGIAHQPAERHDTDPEAQHTAADGRRTPEQRPPAEERTGGGVGDGRLRGLHVELRRAVTRSVVALLHGDLVRGEPLGQQHQAHREADHRDAEGQAEQRRVQEVRRVPRGRRRNVAPGPEQEHSDHRQRGQAAQRPPQQQVPAGPPFRAGVRHRPAFLVDDQLDVVGFGAGPDELGTSRLVVGALGGVHAVSRLIGDRLVRTRSHPRTRHRFPQPPDPRNHPIGDVRRGFAVDGTG
jgi:hypothetical protein